MSKFHIELILSNGLMLGLDVWAFDRAQAEEALRALFGGRIADILT